MERLHTDNYFINADAAVLKLGGFIDSTNACKLRQSIESLREQKRYKIVMDFRKIEYVSSAGWGVLIGQIRDVRENKGDIILCSMIESVKSIYQLMELDQLFRFCKTVEEALKLFGKKMEMTAGSTSLRVGNSREAANEKVKLEEKSEKKEKIVTTVRSLEDEIRLIIAETPLLSVKLLRQELRKSEHGAWKVSWFNAKRELKKLGLGSVKSRLYYAFTKAKEEK